MAAVVHVCGTLVVWESTGRAVSKAATQSERMTFLPVVQRELQVAARSAGVRWQRFVAVALGVMVFALIVVISRQTPRAVAGPLFHTLASVLWIMAWLSGPLFTTDALTREKREGTLGLLLLTDLRGYDIVLGKLAATAMHQVMLLAGVLPVLALPMALGGIAPSESWRVMASLLLTQGLSLAAGLFFSTVCRTFWQALSWTLGSLGLLTLLPPAIDWGFRAAGIWVPDFLQALGPLGLTLCGVSEFQRTHPTAAAQWATGAFQVIGIMVLAISGAAVLLGRRLDDAETARAAAARSTPPHSLAGWRHIHWREWLDENPYYWLERACRAEKRPFGSVAWIAIGVSGAAATLMAYENRWGQAGFGWLFPTVAILGAFLATQCVKLGLLMAATRRLGDDLRTGGLELLLTTPLTPAEIVAGCRLALTAEFRPVFFALHFLYAVVLLEFLTALSGRAGFPHTIWPLFIGASIMLALDFRWGTSIALRAALREVDPLKALRRAVLRLMLPGWCALVLLLVAVYIGHVGVVLAYILFYSGAMLAVRLFARRASIDLQFGLRDIAAGAGYDTDQRELAEDFRRAAMTWEDRWFTPH